MNLPEHETPAGTVQEVIRLRPDQTLGCMEIHP